MRLSQRQLNRATLARQLLLERVSLPVPDAVAQLGGLQAQEPASPHLALRARLDGFSADDLNLSLVERSVVKATLQRSTLHIVETGDYRASLPALTEVRRTRWMNESRGLPVARSLPELAEASLRYARQPRTNVALRDHAGRLGEPVAPDELWRRIRRYAAFIHVPGDEPWGFGRRPVQIAAGEWTEPATIDLEASLEHVVRVHLGAFGPSRLADIARWSGLSVGSLRRGMGRISHLERHQNERGQELLDLPGAPVPHPDTPAPPRLLPMWDETLLAYADRSRMLPERYRRRVIVKAGDVLPTFTVDGCVAGLWWAEADGGGRSHIVLEPFEPLGRAARSALETEAELMAVFIAAREPEVYRRYRRTRRRP